MFELVKLQEKYVKGRSIRTSNALEMTEERKIPEHWQRYFEEEKNGSAPQVIALYSDYESDENGEYLLTIGAFVEENEQNAIFLPPTTYAKFQSRKGPIDEIVLETWQIIWQWDKRQYRTYTGDYELYDERALNPKEAQVDIYIAVRDEISSQN
ncbi:GyrI-like domain-containing protein [Bacillus sp. NPDC077027]|uniref:GyrI-like domain-containing protein n=1 Tax=Bacillus sp. NPDC077027 TaxID=3390548 RepID=UPI003CFEE34A